MGQAVIVSCGEALVDVLTGATASTQPGGGPMNVAVAAARLGAPAAFVGRVSTDAYGETIWHHLADNGVDVRAAERGPEPTARAIVETEPTLSFRFEGANTADTCLAAADLSLLGQPAADSSTLDEPASPASAASHIDTPIVHGGTLGMFRGRTADVLARLVERHDGLVSLDPNVRPQIIDDRQRWQHYHDRWAARADIYRASDEDLDWIWPHRPAADCAAELLARGASAVLVTAGGDGVTLYRDAAHNEPDSLTVAGARVDVVDTVGAGDTFIAAVLVGLAQRSEQTRPVGQLDADAWRGILTRAVNAAAITCSRAGANPPTRAELDAFERR